MARGSLPLGRRQMDLSYLSVRSLEEFSVCLLFSDLGVEGLVPEARTRKNP